MKYILKMILILSVNIAIYGQADNIIYKEVMDVYVFKHVQPNLRDSPKVIVVLKAPIYLRRIDSSEFYLFNKKYKSLDRQTFENFLENRKVDLQLRPIEFSDVKIVIIDKEQIENKKELFDSYPNWNGSILEFSNIGFNRKKDQAILYHGFKFGQGAGGGIYIVLKKKWKKWKIKKVIPSWAN